MKAFAGSRTEANLRRAFATATLASRHYETMAERADAEGKRHAAALFHAVGQVRARQAEALLGVLARCGDGTSTIYDIRQAIMDELDAGAGADPAMARTARQEGFDAIERDRLRPEVGRREPRS